MSVIGPRPLLVKYLPYYTEEERKRHCVNRKIIGISIARKNPRGREIILDSIREYMPNINETELQEKTIFLDQYIGKGYGNENSEIKEMIRNSMVKYGIPMDSTYTAKAFLGMKKYIRTEKIVGKRVLFIHTGGRNV